MRKSWKFAELIMLSNQNNNFMFNDNMVSSVLRTIKIRHKVWHHERFKFIMETKIYVNVTVMQSISIGKLDYHVSRKIFWVIKGEELMKWKFSCLRLGKQNWLLRHFSNIMITRAIQLYSMSNLTLQKLKSQSSNKTENIWEMSNYSPILLLRQL